MLQILDIIAPVFLIIGLGFLSVRKGLFNADWIDGLMKFSIQFAVPCLLFGATARLDLNAAYDWGMMAGFYIAAASSFALTAILARVFFQRHPGESVAIGFAALFSNSVLIGLALSERAWGVDNMATAYAIISVHAPFCYLLGITTMEVLRSDGRSWPQTARVVVGAMFRNTLMIGIGLGFIVNLSGIDMPGLVESTVDILSRAALPVALFGIGGVLTRYRLSEDMGEVGMVTGFSLLFHPTAAYFLCRLFDVPHDITSAAVLIAAMPPGINVYLFACMYQRGQSVAASSVVFSTAASVVTITGWLWILTG